MADSFQAFRARPAFHASFLQKSLGVPPKMPGHLRQQNPALPSATDNQAMSSGSICSGLRLPACDSTESSISIPANSSRRTRHQNADLPKLRISRNERRPDGESVPKGVARHSRVVVRDVQRDEGACLAAAMLHRSEVLQGFTASRTAVVSGPPRNCQKRAHFVNYRVRTS